MSKLVLRIAAGAFLALGLAIQPSGHALAQESKTESKAESKSQTKSASAKSGDAKQDGAAEAKAKKPLTAQQLKMKECGAKWQDEKKAKGVKGREAWNKFRSACLKS